MRWGTSFREADALVAAGRLRDAYRAKALGLAGTAHFRLGELGEAARQMREALEECRRTGDAEGVEICEANLDVIAKAPLVS